MVQTDTEKLILDQLRELRSEWRASSAEVRAEMATLRTDLRDAMIEVGSLRARITAWAAVIALIASGTMQIAANYFFR